jgi:hypothetical protein
MGVSQVTVHTLQYLDTAGSEPACAHTDCRLAAKRDYGRAKTTGPQLAETEQAGGRAASTPPSIVSAEFCKGPRRGS